VTARIPSVRSLFDAAGRVLFRRPATQQEVTDALRSADEADREGEAVMERISYDRMFQELIGDSE
jgi:SOS response regulatory protein OraA/RecX